MKYPLGTLSRPPLQLAQGPHLVATDGMGTRHAFLGPTNVQDGMGEIHLIPARDAFVAVV